LDRDRDTLGRERSTGILPVTNGAAEHTLTYDYDESGRLASVTSPAGTFTYSYTPGSSLIASVTGPVHTVTNTWEPNRDVLDVKDNRIPSTTPPISRFDYGVNNIGQRTGVTTTGTACPSQPADWTWGYDPLGQVTSADSPTSTFDRAYEYDQIGNRKKSADSLTLPGTDNYSANILNQYQLHIGTDTLTKLIPAQMFDDNIISANIFIGNMAVTYEFLVVKWEPGKKADEYNYTWTASMSFIDGLGFDHKPEQEGIGCWVESWFWYYNLGSGGLGFYPDRDVVRTRWLIEGSGKCCCKQTREESQRE
jgi:YD repeat-containing protein